MNRQTVIRVGGAADTEAVAALHSESWRTAYAGIVPPGALGDGLAEERRDIWAIRLTADYGTPGNTPLLLVAELDGETVGFAYLVPQPDGRVLVDSLHVRPGLTGGGIGRALLDEALVRTPHAPLYLEVLSGNTRAVAFYERAGGVRTDEREGWFPGGHLLPEYEYTWAPGTRGASA
ncbi:GNAT family N-acetyltransferase [Kitasatospora sp. NPDC056138]|uniref:GNAT family N-acetyltransferase n=1 Tax=Kitasatospora sp. NPDC056138 TaxID=3345724 RepID=UPI0035D76200